MKRSKQAPEEASRVICCRPRMHAIRQASLPAHLAAWRAGQCAALTVGVMER